MKNKVDIKTWKEFRIGDLFDIHPTKAYKMNNSSLLEENGENPVIVNSSYNNGVGGYSNLECTEKGNIVTFSDTTSADSIFYQEDDFIGYPHVQGLYPIGKYKNMWNKYTYMFFITVFREKAKNLNYDYVNKFTRDSAKDIQLKLPIDINKNPDWNYMQEYMESVEKKCLESVNHLNGSISHTRKMDISKWKSFHLYDIFEIDSGTKMDKIAMKFDNPTINFVGRSGINNGVTAIVDEIDGYKPYKAGYLTLALGGAYLGSCFVQDKDFYTSQNVIVLIPKHEMSIYTKHFICSVIFKEGNLHYKAFIDELNRHIKTDFMIKLPALKNGEPDYGFMNDYIEKKHKEAKENIDFLKLSDC